MMKSIANAVESLEMCDIFQVIPGGKVSRWGFFANQDNGTCVIYKPEVPVCSVDELYMIEEDGPGAIDIVEKEEIENFLNSISDELTGMPAAEVSLFTPCGWYYDTIV